MAGSTPKTHRRIVDGASYVVATSQHEHGISIVVNVPGVGPAEENDRTYATEAEALSAADEIARKRVQQRADLDAGPSQ